MWGHFLWAGGTKWQLPDALVRFANEVLSQAEQLEGRDLAVTKISINMGKTSNDALGRLNPVEKMLFYHKGNLQAREITSVLEVVVSWCQVQC